MLRECVQRLLELAPLLEGKRIIIHESISRSRDVGGHDRHFATSSQLRLTVQQVTTALSGSQLQFNDEADQRYGVALDVVVDVQYVEGQRLEIREHFETKTERRTVISLIE